VLLLFARGGGCAGRPCPTPSVAPAMTTGATLQALLLRSRCAALSTQQALLMVSGPVTPFCPCPFPRAYSRIPSCRGSPAAAGRHSPAAPGERRSPDAAQQARRHSPVAASSTQRILPNASSTANEASPDLLASQERERGRERERERLKQESENRAKALVSEEEFP